MDRENIMKIIDGVVYYHYDYTDYLYNIINKAIEYIEEYNLNNMEYNAQTLLNILKGEDNDNSSNNI